MRYLTAFLFFLLFALQPAHAFEIVDAQSHGQPVSLKADTLSLPDTNNAISPEAALNRMSQPGYQSGTLDPDGKQAWFYTPLINRIDNAAWVINVRNGLLRELDFYLYCQGGGLQPLSTPPLGVSSPTLASSYYLPINLPQNTECGFLQRVRATTLIPTKVFLLPASSAVQNSNLGTVLNLMMLGIIAGLIVYNFLLFISIRNASYLFYTLYGSLHFSMMVKLSLYRELFSGVSALFTDPKISLHILSAMTMIALILFTLSFMRPGIQTIRHNPKRQKLFTVIKTLITLCIVSLLMMVGFLAYVFTWPEGITNTKLFIHFYIVATSLTLIPLLSLAVALGGYRPAWVLFPAWTILVVGHIVPILGVLQFIDMQGWGRLVTTSVTAMEMIMLSMALGMHVKESMQGRERAQMARENAELMLGQRERFISTLSHEIRTPLHAMLGATCLLGRTDLSGKQQQYWQTAHYAAESMYALVDNLLDRIQFKNIQKMDKDTEFDPQRLLEALIQLLHHRAAEKDLELRLHTHNLPPCLIGKPVVLRRMLINLISNAIKNTEVGDISVSVAWKPEQSELHVVVEDTGRGMSEEQLAHIEARFNTGVEALYSQNASSGLGLPICFEMIRAAGGDLSLESRLGYGTKARFTLGMRLPTVSDPAEQAMPAASSHKNLTILVVDDAASNRMIASELLMSAGHKVSQAEDGEHAWELLQEQAFDVVFSDVRMPRMDGFQLLEKIRQQDALSELVVVLTSAHFDKEQRERLAAMGTTVLAKPYTPDELLACVHGVAPASAEQSQPVLSKVFADLQHRLGEETAAEIIMHYRQQLAEDIGRITHGASRQEVSDMRIAAHRIVSSSRALGLHENAEAAREIEVYGENDAEIDWEQFNELITHNLSLISLKNV
ncbi:response regulator [Thiothrix nivea]|uniref:response regulator n=1 Tax=Thiothrix nivea TaxID=1031 RepID=UPI000302283C|nr:response regulator [Thiothrix nivea]